MSKSAPPGSATRWWQFIGSMVLAIALITAGVWLMFMNLAALPQPVVIGMSLLMLAGSLWVLGPLPSSNWAVSLGLLGIGLYGLARGIGAIEYPWLAHLIGFACVAAACLVLVAFLPGVKPSE